MSKKLCLQWNDFQSNINSALKELRKENDMTDVTLVSEEGKQVGAHKGVLFLSSPFHGAGQDDQASQSLDLYERCNGGDFCCHG